jgi:hypothetical protein
VGKAHTQAGIGCELWQGTRMFVALLLNKSISKRWLIWADPYPWAIEEGFDAYRTLMETKGKCIGIHSGKIAVVLTGDSA